MKKHLPTVLFILSIVFLIPGISQPLMTIKATIDKQEMLDLATKALVPPDQGNNFVQNMLQSVFQQLKVEGTIEVFESTRSLLETMSELISHDHAIVGLLIGLFGVIIPVIKIMLTLIALFLNSPVDKDRLLGINSLLSKWSMSDVFVMAIIVSFMTINANKQSVDAVQMSATLGSGFYFFVAYCLLAIAAAQLFARRSKLESVRLSENSSLE
jgi:uncharacterized paraquat-inducible protein A